MDLRSYEASTILALGARGVRAGVGFGLVGRTCVRGRSGSIWNEWTMRFDDGRSAFLAEANGVFTLYDEGSLLPSWEALTPGEALDPGYVVVERGVATRVAHWGDVGEAPRAYRYADLSGRRSASLTAGSAASATIDFGGETAHLFVGTRVTLADLDLAPIVAHPRFIPTTSVSRPKGVDMWLDVGDEGILDGVCFRVMGMLSRSADGVPWDEYLLHEAHAGLRWLVVTDGHWSVVASVEPGLVHESASRAVYDSESFEFVSEGTARVDWATGELPWGVSVGDESRVKDFAGVAHVLTKEWTADSVAWSHGVPVAPDVLARAFGTRALPKPGTRPR